MDDATPPGWTFADWVDEVWHRNLVEPVSDLPGDRALHDAVQVHSRVSNGGTLHAVEVHVEEGTWDASLAALRFLGLAEPVAVLERVRTAAERPGLGGRALDRLEVQADDWMDGLLDDDVLTEALAGALRSRPDAFAAPTAANVAQDGEDEDDEDADGGSTSGSTLRRMLRRAARLKGARSGR